MFGDPKTGIMGCHSIPVLDHAGAWEAYGLPRLDLQVRMLVSGIDEHNLLWQRCCSMYWSRCREWNLIETLCVENAEGASWVHEVFRTKESNQRHIARLSVVPGDH